MNNRDIKFRAWNKSTNEMNNYVEVYSYKDGSFGCSASNENNNPIGNSENFILMQYTGLKDKNGKEIYEGDICNYIIQPNSVKPTIIPHLIVYNVDGFQGINLNKCKTDFLGRITYQNAKRFNYKDWNKLEIIGNIYENQELLK